MRDVSAKNSTLRTAAASAVLRAAPSTIEALRTGRVPKADPLIVARVAAIQAAKNTPLLIPYCHSVPLDQVTVDFEIRDDSILVTTTAKAVYKTGVEMEALTAAAAAALNLYDLLKPLGDDTMIIECVKLLSKTGGKSALKISRAWRAAVVVASDRASRGEMVDDSGPALADCLRAQGAWVDSVRLTTDDEASIREAVLSSLGVDVIVVTGGTGIGPRDVTPEAILPMLDRRLPGVEEHFRSYSQARTPTAMFSRTLAGTIGKTIILGIPGSPGAVRDAVDALFPSILHGLGMLQGDGHG